MLEKLKVLVLLQLSEKIKITRDETFLKKLGKVGKTILAMGAIYGVFVLLLYLLSFLNISGTQNLFTFIILLLQVLSIISQSRNLYNSLYLSKDNQLLLTYPVKHIIVYISKIIVAFVLELMKNLLIMLPLFMAYMTMNPSVFSVSYIILSVLYTVILALIPVLIGSIISIPFVYIIRFVKKSAVVKTIVMVGVLALLVLITIWAVNIIPDPLNLRDLFLTFLDKMEEVLGTINKYSFYVGNVGSSMYKITPFVNFLFVLLYLIGFGVLSSVLSIPLFFKLASSVTENASQKKHKPKNIKFHSTFVTFLKKELVLSIRNIGDFISNYFFLFLMPFIVIIVASIFVRLDRNTMGITLTYGCIALIVFVMLSASNTASATAISSEGNEFVLLKTAPGNTKSIVWSKLLLNYIISLVFLTITFVALDIVMRAHFGTKGYNNPELYYNSKYIYLIYMFACILNLGLILWSIKLDILHPAFREYENSRSRDSVSNFSKSIIIGLICGVLFSAITIVTLVVTNSLPVIALVFLGVSVAFDAVALYFLVNYMNAYYDDIEI